MRLHKKMLHRGLLLAITGMCQSLLIAAESGVHFDQYPSAVLSNANVKMKVYLPDPENGAYRGTRYDWSGMIGNVQYKGHEYFGYWKDAYDPLVGAFGPADTYKTAGLGYDEAKPGETFIRIGVGFLEKEDEPEYDYHNTYKLVDNGKWMVEHGSDWITFTHSINSDFGYGYIYTKTVKLKDDGFIIKHVLKNTGEKSISTDQYNHNFFLIDNERCGPAFEISYPYSVSTKDDLKGLMEVKDNSLRFTKEMEKGSVFMGLEGYSEKIEDNQFTIENSKSGAGVTVTVDKPVTKLEFWSNGRVICPENTIQLTVEPGQEEVWTADYSLFQATKKPRLIVLADMGNEPDEMQQMIHMITCSNEFEIEGLIAVTGKYLRPGSRLGEYNWVTHPELYFEIIDAYAKVYKNLQIHAKGWPEPDALKKRVAAGQTEYGIADVKEGNSSAGSELIIQALTKDDDRPVWIVVNAGSNTLAQALVDYRATHTQEELEKFVAKIRVFENGSQDNAGAWICSQFPSIHWIHSNYQTYAYGGPSRKKLGPHYWKPYANNTQGQLDWQKEHIMVGHGPLGALYPPRRFHAWGDGVVNFMEGGGTIPWMGLVNKGLFDINHPSWGGWGGRFSTEKTMNFWSRHKDIRQNEEKVAPFYTYSEVSDTWTDPESNITYCDNYVPVWRWRQAMYNDFKCRMDWCVQLYDKANHHPIAAFGTDLTDSIIRITASRGETIDLDASASKDPDNDELSFRWWHYQEAGTYAGRVHIPSPEKAKTQLTIPTGAGGKQIHIILEIKDTNPIASLFDYRRLVIDVTPD